MEIVSAHVERAIDNDDSQLAISIFGDDSASRWMLSPEVSLGFETKSDGRISSVFDSIQRPTLNNLCPVAHLMVTTAESASDVLHTTAIARRKI